MRRRRPVSYNPSQALMLISTDRSGGASLVCPACGEATIQREPKAVPPRPRSHVTLRCTKCERFARYIVGSTP